MSFTEDLLDIADVIADACETVGDHTAVVLFQGLVHQFARLTLIDGKIHDELVPATRVAIIRVGRERLVELYLARIAKHLPAEPTIAEPELPLELPVEKPKSRKKRAS